MPLGSSENLRNHTLDWHEADTHSPHSQSASYYANYVEHALQNVVVVPRPPSHGYTAVRATLFRSNSNSETVICLNTGSTTTFIDRGLVGNGPKSDEHPQSQQKAFPRSKYWITNCGIAHSHKQHLIILPHQDRYHSLSGG